MSDHGFEDMGDGRFLLKLDSALYHKEAILSASYKFLNDCYIALNSVENEFVISFLSKSAAVDITKAVHEFCNELVDQELRFSLTESNKSIKELIVKRAFFPFQNE